MKILRIVAAVLFAAILAHEARLSGSQSPDTGGLKTRNIILVTTDGLRWQEVFGGADPALMNPGEWRQGPARLEGGNSVARRPRSAARPSCRSSGARSPRRASSSATPGDEVKVTNGRNFSYPGYNEIFTGWADPRIDSNNKVPNHNVTVLEWLNRKEEFRHRVAAFGSWDVFPYILNRWRSKVRVQAAWKPPTGKHLSDEERAGRQADARRAPSSGRSAASTPSRSTPRWATSSGGSPGCCISRWARPTSGATPADTTSTSRGPSGRRLPEDPLGDGPVDAGVPRHDDDDRDHRPWAGRCSRSNGRATGPRSQGSDRIWIAVIGPDTAPGARVARQSHGSGRA